MSQIPATQIRQVMLLLILAAIFWVIFWNLSFFFPAFLGAYTFYVLLRTPLFFLIEKWKWPIGPAAAMLMLLSFVVIIIPCYWVFDILREQILYLSQHSESILQNAEQIVREIENQYKVTLLTADNVKALSNWATGAAQGVVVATMNGMLLLLATYFILWFMLTEGKRMEQTFFNWMPLHDENVAYVKKHLNDLVWGNALGIPLMGLVQGLAGLLIYWLAGIHNPFLWFAITCLAGMMPIVGVALAYVPLSLLLLSQGEEGKALLIFLYGFIIVGSVDNIAVMWLMKKISRTHPLITLFGIIVGLQLFGFIGFIFGPILISLFILLLRIYQKEFIRRSE